MSDEMEKMNSVIYDLRNEDTVDNNEPIGDLSKYSFTDLYNMYLFVNTDTNRVFNKYDKSTKELVFYKKKLLEEELYIRVYGHNPYIGI